MNDTVTSTEARPSVSDPVPVEGTILADWGCRASGFGGDIAAYGIIARDRSVTVGVDWSGAIVYAVTGEEPERFWWFAEVGDVREVRS